MAKKRPVPVLTHTELLCLAYRALEDDVRHWQNACAGHPDADEQVQHICARQLAQMDAIREMYRIETCTEL